MKHYLVKYSITVNETSATEKHIFETESTDPIQVAEQAIQSIYGENISVEYPGKYYVANDCDLAISIESIMEIAPEDLPVLEKYILKAVSSTRLLKYAYK